MSAQPLPPPSIEPSIEVARVAWPADEHERRRLAGEALPRLLLVAAEAAPPVVTDELEDWVREPVDVVEQAMRCETLRQRARRRYWAPRLDADGLLRHGGRWVAVSPAQVPLVELLVSELGRVVRTSDLRLAHARTGGSDDLLAVKAVLRRLTPALASVGLHLHRLRDRGYLLERAEPDASVVLEAPRSPSSPAPPGRPPEAARRASVTVAAMGPVRRASWARPRVEVS